MKNGSRLSWRYAAGIPVVGVCVLAIFLALSAAQTTSSGVFRTFGNVTLAPEACPSPSTGATTCITGNATNMTGTGSGPLTGTATLTLLVGASSGTNGSGGSCAAANGTISLDGNGNRTLSAEIAGTICDTGTAPGVGASGPTVFSGGFLATSGTPNNAGSGLIEIGNDGTGAGTLFMNGFLTTGTIASPTPSISPSASPSASPTGTPAL
jgi:hypothetical protein